MDISSLKDETTYHYVRRSVHVTVRPSVLPSVRPSVRFLRFKCISGNTFRRMVDQDRLIVLL